MVFDPCPHQMTQLILKAGAVIRQLKGLPEELNITTLYNETAPLLGIAPNLMSSKDVNHFPKPEETGPFGECPKCHKQTLVIKWLCQSCEKSANGQYKTEWVCVNKECGYDVVSEMFLIQAYNHFGIPVPEGMKIQLGIKTVTDEEK